MLQQGETVEIKTGFVLLEGSETEQRLHDGFLMWLEFSGAGGDGIPVGNGFVTVSHSTEYAEKDGNCEGYHAAARRLIEQKVGFFCQSLSRLDAGDRFIAALLLCLSVPHWCPPHSC